MSICRRYYISKGVDNFEIKNIKHAYICNLGLGAVPIGKMTGALNVLPKMTTVFRPKMKKCAAPISR